MQSQADLIARMLLGFGCLVMVPLGLQLLLDPQRARARPSGWCLATASAAFAVAIVISSTRFAFALALPWTALVISILLARGAALRAAMSLDNLVVAVAIAWLALAAAWTCAALARGAGPATADHLRWVTPAHFLYAGFGLTIVALTAWRQAHSVPSAIVMGAVLVAMPVLAAQIGFAPGLQWTGAAAMGLAGLCVSVEQTCYALRSEDPIARLVLLASSTAVAIGMVLGIGYGLSTRWGFQWLALDTMAASHGVLNAIGFTFLAIIGWLRLLSTSPPVSVAHTQASP